MAAQAYGDGQLAALPLGAAVWDAPFPALLENFEGCIVRCNAAFAHLRGESVEQLCGRRIETLLPVEDVELYGPEYAKLRERARTGQPVPPQERRFTHTDGSIVWCRIWLTAVAGEGAGAAAVLWWMQDITAEQQAQLLAERTLSELTQWFDLSPSGKVVYDSAGLVLRSNPVFEALVGGVPVSLADAPVDLQHLLGWRAGGLRIDLQPGMPVIETSAEFQQAQGRTVRVSARLRAFVADDGLLRVMAVVEDRSAEAERDLAQFEMGALMNAAGLGVATFDARALRPMAALAAEGSGAPLASGMQSIQRHMVDPGSRAAYDRLQDAVRSGSDAEVRYAVRHPELGPRWLLTRVAAAHLPTGRHATSVVTLDITEQETARQRGEKLLRELTATLDASPVGIAYLRDGRLVRCNRRFERMLGFDPGAVAGADFQAMFAMRGAAHAGVQTALAAVESNRPCDVEIEIGLVDGERTWYALSVRRAETDLADTEAVAVLSDITHLKRQQAEIERTAHERELMFNQSDIGMAWLRQGCILRANRAMAALTGWPDAELQGLSLRGLVEGAPDFEHVEASVRHALRALGRFDGDLRLRRRDGSLCWVHVAVRPFDASDADSDLICSFLDIDERQFAREALQEQARRTRAVLDSVLVGIVTVDENGIEWMNRSARRMFAGELADFVGANIGTVATREPDHPLNRKDWLQRLADGEAESFECRLKARDGREFWVVGNAVATSRGAAAGRQLTFALLDIEARRQAEVRISGARASLQRLIETAPLAIAVFDAADGRVVECNQAAEAFFGRDAAQLRGSLAQDCFTDPQEAAALSASLVLARDTAEGVRREITRPSAAGQMQRWDTRFVHLPDAGADPAPGRGQVLLVANDVTELRQAEQARLDAAIAQREMLVKEVHHRIKNNLQGVAGLLQQSAQRRPEVRTELGDAISQVQAIAQVYGLQVGAEGPLDLAGVLAAVAGSVQRSLQRAIDLQWVDRTGPRWMLPEAESIPLALTLNELLTNAVRHSEPGPIRCAMHARDGDVLIEIANLGHLPEGFDLTRLPAGMYGLGLVRSLLPRRAASLTLTARDGEVVTALTLKPPSVRPASVA